MRVKESFLRRRKIKTNGVGSSVGKGIKVVNSEHTTENILNLLLAVVYAATAKDRDAEKIVKSLIMPKLISDDNQAVE